MFNSDLDVLARTGFPQTAERIKNKLHEKDEEIKKLRAALEKIAAWETPDMVLFWDYPKNTRPMSYRSAYGSNGERDVMRSLASAALEP